MKCDLDGQAVAIEQALAGGAPQSVGWFRFYVEDQRWEWSDQVQLMHGYEPGTVSPTTELVLSHKHPDDREQVAATIDDMTNKRGAFSTRHRIIDTRGTIRHVVVVGDRLCDDDGEVIGSHGFYVDVTCEFHRDSQNAITAKVAEIAERRGAIDETKGMLMLIYNLDSTSAFNLLKSLSQIRNIKLGLLAEQIATEFSAVAETAIPSRSAFDQVLLTAHLRRPDDEPDSATA